MDLRLMPAFDPDVPPRHQIAAEEIRAHLVAVRGGAPFLSSADARLLLDWLEREVPVTDVLRAIERAAEARRARRSRLPLTLGRAKAHLGKGVTAGAHAAAVVVGAHPLEPVARAVAERGAVDLADRLRALDAGEPEALVRSAAALARAHLSACWEALPAPERQRRLDELRAELADLNIPPPERDTMADEIARDEIRQEWPMLDIAHLWSHAHRSAG